MAVRRTLVAGRYRLREPVGTGGMGRVWLARDEMLDRDVAVKEFVPPEWMTAEEKSRLKDRTLREARSAARLNHPNVVQIYDVVHAGGQPWIVMEYVRSRSLHQVLEEDGPFAPGEAARIGLHILDALTAAHRAGVLHRDIKPHNVLMGEDGRVVLTDFGLATFVDDGSVTGPGLIVGSPQYVSPERARDGASTVESDLWSFGATLYAAVEGRSPYARESAMATLMALATEGPDVPERAGALAPVLTGLLRHDPETRLTAAEVDRRLRMIIAESEADQAPEVRRAPVVNGNAVRAVGAVVVPASRGAREDRGHAEIAMMSGPEPVGPARRRGSHALVRALPTQRTSSGPLPSVAPEFDEPTTDASPTPRFSRQAMIVTALTAVAILGVTGIVAGYLVQRDDPPARVGLSVRASGAAAASSVAPSVAPPKAPAIGGFTPAACSGPVPSKVSRTPQRNATRGVGGYNLYAGWSYFSDGSGFHIPVPDNWTYQKFGTTYCFRDPDGPRLMILDTGRKPTADPVAACRAEAKRVVASGALPSYRLVTIEPRPLLDKAAD
jgi:tRNA A-37 threonylcarbamoyl transferase component Bud32